MILKLLREGLGRVVLFVEWITRPSAMSRSPERQAEIDAQVRDMRLYQFYACPFCIKTRRVIHRLNLPIETRNVNEGSPYRDELAQGGGQIQVPCLYLREDGKDVWMYESSDIIDYLQNRFGVESA
jgi:glutaredoxin